MSCIAGGVRMSELAGDHPEIAEMDLNPILVLEPGAGCIVLDARVAVRPPAPGADASG